MNQLAVTLTVAQTCFNCSYTVVSDVVEKNIDSSSKSRIPCAVLEKNTTRRRQGVGVVVEKNEESRRTFNTNSCDLLKQ